MAQSGKALYQRYIQVISRWPIEPLKEGRDLGVKIRARFGDFFPRGEHSTLEPAQHLVAKQEIESLERLVSNKYRNRYSFYANGYKSLSGFKVKDLTRITSTDFIEEYNNLDQELTFWQKMKLRAGLGL